MPSRRLLGFIAGFVFLLASAIHAQIKIDTVYVTVTGDNSFGTGTKDKPWRSVTSAMQRITADSLNRKVIKLGAGTFGVATTGEVFPIALKSFVVVQGNGKLQTKIDAAKAARIFTASNVRHNKLLDLALENGRAKGPNAAARQGAALRVKKFFQLEIRNCDLRGNQADSSGGALFISSGTGFTLQNCLLEKNTASDGGAVYHDSSKTTLVLGNTVQNNTATNTGGGLYFDSASPTLQKNRVRWNKAQQKFRNGGGGLMFVNAQAVVGGAFDLGNDMHDNLGGDRGAQIYVVDARSAVDARFNFFGAEPATATAYPASLLNLNNFRTVAMPVPFGAKDFYVDPSGSDENNGTNAAPWRTINFALSQVFARELDTLRLHLKPGVYSPLTTGEQFPIRLETQVSLIGSGAASTIIEGTGSTNNAEMVRIFFAENLRLEHLTLRKAKNCALSARHADRLTLENLIFEDNAGTRGAGALVVESSHAIIQQNIFRRNKSTQNGGSLALVLDDAQVLNNIFTDNSAKLGGAIHCDSSSSTRFEQNEIRGNRAENGGGIFIAQSTPKIILNRILQNQASTGGGGIALDGAAVPDIGARKSQANDIYDNTSTTNASQVFRTSPGVTVDARYNYWGEVPSAKLIAPLAQFSLNDYRNVALQILLGVTEIFVAPTGDDRAEGSLAKPLRTISGALKLFFGTAATPMKLTLAAGIYSQATNDEALPIKLENYVTIVGASNAASEINASNETRIFESENTRNFSVQNLTLRNGFSALKGGAAYLDSVQATRWEKCVFINNNATHGGALAFESGRNNTLSNTRFQNNKAVKRGGAVLIESDSVVVDNCDFISNQAALNGGALHNGAAAYLKLQNSRVKLNQAPKGGGLAVFGGFAHLVKNLIIDNSASDTTGGGGVYIIPAGNALIGGNANDGNDLYGNQSPVSGATLASPARGNVIDARFNYFGATPASALVNFMSAFNTDNARHRSIIIPTAQKTLYVAPNGNDETAIIIPPTPLRTVQQALRMFYNSPGEAMTISLAAGTYSSATNGEKFPIALKSRTRLVGTHPDSALLNGIFATRLLEIAEAESIEVRNLSLLNGKSVDNGAGLRARNAKSVVLANVYLSKNTTSGFGAGLSADNVQGLQISQSRFLENTGNGAGAFIRASEGVIFGSLFQSNKSPARGSALYLEDAALKLQSSRVIQNLVEGGDTGGAIYCRGTIVPIIGGEAGRGNDIFNNTGGASGKELSRTGTSPIINARYNYFGTPTPGEVLVSPLPGFDLAFARTQPLANNNTPVVQSVSPVTNQTIVMSKEDTVNFVVSLVDPDNDPLTYVWAVDDFPLSFGASFSLLSVFYAEGMHTVRLTVNDGFNTLELNWNVQIGATSVNETKGELPKSFKLEQAYPNPFHAGVSTSMITLHVPRASEVRLYVYDLLGRQVRALVAANKPAGIHRFAWEGKDDEGKALPSGVYVLKMLAGDFHATQKIMLMR